MGYIIKGAIFGFIGILVLSMIMMPFLCYSISLDDEDVNCSAERNINLFFGIYSNIYSSLLLFFGMILGILIMRFIFLIQNKHDVLKQEIYNKTQKNKRFLWMWEYK
jgi:hypothetical protein